MGVWISIVRVRSAMDRSAGDGGIGLAVRRARRSRGLTLEELAGLVGRSKAWLSMIENGQRPLDKRGDIAALASALEVSADALIGQPAPEIQPGRRTRCGPGRRLMRPR